MRVISIDVGGTNGVAIWSIDQENQSYELEYCEGIKKRELYRILEEQEFDLIIYENYRLYSTHSQAMVNNEFEVIQIIGVVKYLAEKRDIEIVSQMASEVKQFFTNDKLRDLGLYVTMTHRRDAIRHFLNWYYLKSKMGNLEDLLPKD